MTVPTTWVEQTANMYSPEIGLIGGFTLQKATTPFEGMQSLDWTFILGMAAAMAGLGHPLGSIGNNLSFRKSAYDQVGGYRELKFSVTEDYTVVQAIVGLNKWKYLYPIDLKHLVESKLMPKLSIAYSPKTQMGKGWTCYETVWLDINGRWLFNASFSIYYAILRRSDTSCRSVTI